MKRWYQFILIANLCGAIGCALIGNIGWTLLTGGVVLQLAQTLSLRV